MFGSSFGAFGFMGESVFMTGFAIALLAAGLLLTLLLDRVITRR